MTEDDLKKFLADNREDIAAAVKARTIEALTNNLQWSLPAGVQTAVADFVETEIVPEIKAHLEENKGPMVAAAIKAAAEIGDKVAELLVKQAVESMSGYRAGDVVKALMGVR